MNSEVAYFFLDTLYVPRTENKSTGARSAGPPGRRAVKRPVNFSKAVLYSYIFTPMIYARASTIVAAH